MTEQAYRLDARTAQFAEICLQFGVPERRANLAALAIVEAIDKPIKRVCAHEACAKPFRTNQAKRRYCSDACRVASHRARQA